MLFAASPGTTTGELLKVPVGARAIGMGEAYDASMTAGEKGMWESLQKQDPANIAKKSFADGQVQYTWTLKGK